MLAESILCTAHSILAKVVCGELVSLTQKLAILCVESLLACGALLLFSGDMSCRKMHLSARALRSDRDGLIVPGSGLGLLMNSCSGVW